MHEPTESPQPASLVVVDGNGAVELRHDGSPPAVMRERIDALVEQLLSIPGSEVSPPVEHTFCDGMYMRKLTVPKGTLAAGKIHRKSCINIVASGDITVLTEFGCKRVLPGETGVSHAGSRKVVYAHEDTVFINVFRTESTDIDEVEAELACTEHLQVETVESSTPLLVGE
jgi:hypothetical protein